MSESWVELLTIIGVSAAACGKPKANKVKMEKLSAHPERVMADTPLNFERKKATMNPKPISGQVARKIQKIAKSFTYFTSGADRSPSAHGNLYFSHPFREAQRGIFR